MSVPATGFEQRIVLLKAVVVDPGRRVERMLDEAVLAVFNRDREKAAWVIQHDETIDRADVEIERAAVRLLCEIANVSTTLGPDQIRWILTVVKVNNELERIADEAVAIAERSAAFSDLDRTPPERFRVMAHSVIGILQSTTRCFEKVDVALAERVLQSDELVDQFEAQILRDMQQELAEKKVDVDFAFAVNTMAAALERIDDHCTNIAEQTIYVSTGKIVRHLEGHWSAPETPGAA
ncbi:MAG: phosphate signaling complex protein PhoU [Planctomycetota bacterium]|nr:phosphate signaling complex protein PhoU [Planctomycetota bacterium]